MDVWKTAHAAITDPALGFPGDTWETTRPTERATRIKRRLLQHERLVDVERARYTTQSYQQTEGEPMVIRRAKMLLHLARTLSIAIHPDEIIVGNRSLLPRMGVIAPEGAVDWIDQELEILSTRPQDRFQIDPDQIQELRQEIFPYWRGKTLEDMVAGHVPPDVKRAVQGKAFSLNQTDHPQGHILPDVETWVRLGVQGLWARVLAARGGPQAQREEQQAFYDACLIAFAAVRHHSGPQHAHDLRCHAAGHRRHPRGGPPLEGRPPYARFEPLPDPLCPD